MGWAFVGKSGSLQIHIVSPLILKDCFNENQKIEFVKTIFETSIGPRNSLLPP